MPLFRCAAVLAVFFYLSLPTPSNADFPEAEPAMATKDPDFLIQGEYSRDEGSGAEAKFESQNGPQDTARALQVVALGDGEFEIVVFEGGLPGDGWDGAKPRRIEGDEDTVFDLTKSMNLVRTERKSPTFDAKPPAGAVALFDGSRESLANWQDGKISEDGLLIQGTTSKPTFRDYTLHLEFRTPWSPSKRGQGRGNSGVYHQGRYETQVLDSFGLAGKMNETGGIYSIRDPDLNMCFPPLTWQTYDVDFTAARFDGDKKIKNARMTVRLNGVVVQNDVELTHATTASKLREGPEPGPIYLQDHGNQVRYRNIWVLPRDAEREAMRPIVPGFERFYTNNSDANADGGSLLVSTLACDACHLGGEGLLPTKRGPDLTAVRSRVRTDAMVAMIENPHRTKTGTTMPDPWVGLDDATRSQNARDIVSYLVSKGKGELVDRPSRRKISDQGRTLYHQVGCVACHEPMDGSMTPRGTTVPLGDVAKKYTVLSLAKFLKNPHVVRPGSRMPGLRGTATNAFAIASFLTRNVTERNSMAEFERTVYRGSWDNLPDFDSLTPVSRDRVKGLKFNDLKPTTEFGIVYQANIQIGKSGKYEIELSSDDGSRIKIGDHVLTNDGVHPRTTKKATFELAEGIHEVRVELFNKGGGTELEIKIDDPMFGKVDLDELVIDPSKSIEKDLLPSKFIVDSSRVERGERLFQTAGCVQCHQFGSTNSKSGFGKPLATANLSSGCLAENVAAPAVDYKLTTSQRAAIIASIERNNSNSTISQEDSDRRLVHLTMAGLNCYACHQRDGMGGVEPNRDRFFETTIPEMGVEGRLPPALTGVGDKLNDEYFAHVLNEGANDRPYMRAQMPAFGYESLKELHAAINRLDRREEFNESDHSIAEEQIIAGGRQAVGNRGLACIKCHRYDGNKGGGIGAIDLIAMPKRLRESWFHRYLMDPQAYRPGTRMPKSFVNGRSTLTKLYDGDPATQIDAMWQYLKKGTDAKEPEGLKQGSIVLAAGERPLIYRNFFTDVSARGIAVAYPGDVNVIWDAERMTLAKIWKNSFIDASMHWRGRGQGRQQPMGDDVTTWETRTPIVELDAIDQPWPEKFGREMGYRFLGYRLDEKGYPSFRYKVGGAIVTDTPQRPQEPGQAPAFLRLFKFERENDDKVLVWLIGSGEVEKVDVGFLVNGTRVQFLGVSPEIINDRGTKQLRAIIPKGKQVVVGQVIQW